LDYRSQFSRGQEIKNVATVLGIRQTRRLDKIVTLYFRALSTGTRIAISGRMKRLLILIGFLMLTSCAHKAKVSAPASELFLSERYSYIKGNDGRVFIVTNNTKDFDDAVKRIHLGPSSVDKLNLWVITPLKPEKKH
jgi:hypothetical protein